MPLNRELIRNYAQALYEAAREQGLQHQVRKELESLCLFAFEQPDLLRRMAFTFMSSRLSWERKKEFLDAFAGAYGLSEMTRRWLSLMARYGRLNLLAHFIDDFIEVYRDGEHIAPAVVETAFPLDEDQQKRLEAALERALGADVELEIHHNPNLIAGLRVRTRKHTWDYSIRGVLERFAAELA